MKLIHDINPTTKRWPCDSHGGNTYAALGGAIGCTQVGEDQGGGDAHETRRGVDGVDGGLNHPVEKYANRQIGNLPQIGMKIKNI